MRTRATVTIAAALFVVLAGTFHAQRAVFEAPGAAPARNRIDDLVFARLKAIGIAPAPLASDAVFVRRVFLDVIGTLPTAGEVQAFFDDERPDKRAALIDRLLAREEFADYWAMKWSELLRVKSEFPIDLWPNAVQAYHRWIRTAIRDGMPYDRFARELLTANGSNFRVAPVNFYRSVQGHEPAAIASAVALTFMGMRTSAWPKDRLDNMAVFFSQIGYKATGEWKEEIVFFDPDKAPAARTATFPDGKTIRLVAGQDPREAFAAWLVAPGNPYFASAVVNRIWFWLLGRGIVHEADDMRADNPPSNKELLAFLAGQLVSSHYDLKHIYRLILNSSTYQLSALAPASAGRPPSPASSASLAVARANSSASAGGTPDAAPRTPDSGLRTPDSGLRTLRTSRTPSSGRSTRRCSSTRCAR